MNVNMIYSMKGGVGKTALAVYLAYETGAGIITNQRFSTLALYLPEERRYELYDEDGEALPVPIPEDNWNVFFDFAGDVDVRARDAARHSHNIIVPITDDEDSYARGLQTIAELETVNDNIVIIANCIADTDHKRAEGKSANEHHYDAIVSRVREEGFEYPVLPLYKTKAIKRVQEAKKSVDELIAEGKKSPLGSLSSRMFSPAREQFKEILKSIGYSQNN